MFAFFTRNKGTSLWGLANKLTKSCFSSSTAAIGMGIVLGAVLTLLAESNGVTRIVSVGLFSLIAISSSFLVVVVLARKKDLANVGTVPMERINLLLAVALFIIGALLAASALT